MKYFALLLLLNSPFSVFAADLHINVSQLRNTKGQIIVAVFGQKEFGNKKKPLVIDGKEVKFHLESSADTQVIIELPPGEYAVGIIHDENGNGKMDRIPIGPPTEGGTFTGGMNFTGPKSWSQSKILLPPNGSRVTVQMRYWL